jgi:hypothetical protein
MKKIVLLLSLVSFHLLSATKAYDPMEDLLSTAKKEINAKDAIEESKDKVLNDPRRKKVENGFWQFFQAKSDAKPGEFCTAVYWQNDKMISISGPGGEYRGAMLSFIAVEPPETFPRPDDPKEIAKVKVTLKQGNDPAATVTAFNTTIGFSDEIKFAAPTIEAAMAGMDDKLKFKIDYEGNTVFELEWHSAVAAREVLSECLKGKDVSSKEVL